MNRKAVRDQPNNTNFWIWEGALVLSGQLLQACLNKSEIEPQVSDWQIVQIMVTLRKQINLWGRKDIWLVICLKKYKGRVRFAKVKSEVKCQSEKEQTLSFKLKCMDVITFEKKRFAPAKISWTSPVGPGRDGITISQPVCFAIFPAGPYLH